MESLFAKIYVLKETPTQVLSCKICEIFKNIFKGNLNCNSTFSKIPNEGKSLKLKNGKSKSA